MRRLTIFAVIILTVISTAALATNGGQRFIESAVTFLGHPLHPVFVVFPIALFITSLIFDIIYIFNKKEIWHRSAYLLIWGGIIGGLVAAIPGFIDYFLAIPEGVEAHEIAETHYTLNLILLGVFAANLIVRWKMDTWSGSGLAIAVALSVVGVGILLVSGWYGAHMVYEHGVGVTPHMHAGGAAEAHGTEGAHGEESGAAHNE